MNTGQLPSVGRWGGRNPDICHNNCACKPVIGAQDPAAPVLLTAPLHVSGPHLKAPQQQQADLTAFSQLQNGFVNMDWQPPTGLLEVDCSIGREEVLRPSWGAASPSGVGRFPAINPRRPPTIPDLKQRTRPHSV